MFGTSAHQPPELRSLLERTLAADSVPAAPVERYRALALSLERAEPAGKPRVIVVTSALPGEGKTLTVTNLAYTLSRSYQRRVLILDGDLRRPRLHAALSATGTDVRDDDLDHPSVVKAVGGTLVRLGPTLFMLAPSAAAMGNDPVKALNSPETQALIDWARGRFDWVLIDSPPAGLVPDASILTQLADGALFVVLTGRTPAPAARRAISSIGRGRVLGVVMNRVNPNGADGGLGYDDGYYGDGYLGGTPKTDLS